MRACAVREIWRAFLEFDLLAILVGFFEIIGLTDVEPIAVVVVDYHFLFVCDEPSH